MVSNHGDTGHCTRLKRQEAQNGQFWSWVRNWDRVKSWLGQAGLVNWAQCRLQIKCGCTPKNNRLLQNVPVNTAVAGPLVLPVSSCTRGLLVVNTGGDLILQSSETAAYQGFPRHWGRGFHISHNWQWVFKKCTRVHTSDNITLFFQLYGYLASSLEVDWLPSMREGNDESVSHLLALKEKCDRWNLSYFQ